MPIATINPATGETVKTFTAATDDEVDAAIARAHRRFADYRQTSFAQRARWANATADLLEAEADQAAAMMTLEMGKTLAAAKAEALKCAKGFRYYAENAEALLADEPADAAKVGASAAYGRYQPLGVILAVMPWNFPLWQAVRFAAPALMAGNVGLLKHASNVPQCALYLADVIARGGFPDGCFQTLLVSSGAVEAILRDPRVAAATLTGSEPAGQSVGAIAGNEIKPTVLELGGSDPFIVMPSADLDAAVSTAVTGRVQNNGQSCIAAKRFIVHADIYDDFVDKFVARMAALRVGDPTDPDTDVGPLATEQGRNEVAKQVEDAAAAGAVIRCGGKRLDRPGWFYPPTVITDISKDMALYTEEVFGPVASVLPIDTADLGVTLMHEHVFIMTTEIAQNYPEAWGDEDKRVAGAIARLGELKARGVDTIVDLTVIGLGRYIPRIARVAAATELNIVVATGLYTYNDVPFYFHYLGPGAQLDGPEIMTDMFVRDIEHGIADTGIKAGILKCATDEPGLTPGVERVLRAVAQAHKRTGAPISTHTHAGLRRGLDQQRIFAEEGVDLSRVVIGHCGDSTDVGYLEELIAAGSYLGMDRFGVDVISPFQDRVNIVARMCERGHADKMVLSHDACCYFDALPEELVPVAMPNWHYLHIHNDVIPALKQHGVTDEQLHTMLVDNPRRIFERQGGYQ